LQPAGISFVGHLDALALLRLCIQVPDGPANRK
jgi:hypothetical protein